MFLVRHAALDLNILLIKDNLSSTKDLPCSCRHLRDGRDLPLAGLWLAFQAWHGHGSSHRRSPTTARHQASQQQRPGSPLHSHRATAAAQEHSRCSNMLIRAVS